METKVFLECGFWQPVPDKTGPKDQKSTTANEDQTHQKYLILHL